MPNHVVTEIILHGQTLETVMPLIQKNDAIIDFEVLLPLPINSWQ